MPRCKFGFGDSLHTVLTSERGDDRTSLITAFSKGKQLGFGPLFPTIVEPPTSGEESEDELPINPNDIIASKMTSHQVTEYNTMVTKQAEEKGQPSFKEVVERLYEPSLHITSVQNESDIPEKVLSHELMLSHLESWVNAKAVKQSLDQILTLSKFP